MLSYTQYIVEGNFTCFFFNVSPTTFKTTYAALIIFPLDGAAPNQDLSLPEVVTLTVLCALSLVLMGTHD